MDLKNYCTLLCIRITVDYVCRRILCILVLTEMEKKTIVINVDVLFRPKNFFKSHYSV